MNVHPVLREDAEASQLQLPRSEPDGQPNESSQLAWRFLLHQRESALAQWYRARTADARGSTRKTLIVALARKLLIGLWRLVTTGEAPHGVVLRPAG
jgi:hypothetical protein